MANGLLKKTEKLSFTSLIVITTLCILVMLAAGFIGPSSYAESEDPAKFEETGKSEEANKSAEANKSEKSTSEITSENISENTELATASESENANPAEIPSTDQTVQTNKTNQTNQSNQTDLTVQADSETKNSETKNSDTKDSETKDSDTERKEVEEGVERIYGEDRIDTSLSIASEIKSELSEDIFDSVIITRSDRWQDALSGSYLASVENAPILLINSSKTEEVIKYVEDNLGKDGTIYILGGELAVSTEIESKLSQRGNTVRLAGNDSYATNLSILREADARSKALAEEGKKPWDTDLLVTTGKNFPDAISASSSGKPIMLIYEVLSTAQKLFLNEHLDEESNIYIVGGTSAVSEAVEAELAETSKSEKAPVRIAGADRYETSVVVAETFFNDNQEVLLARGDIFPDAMAGGVLASVKGVPLLLSENDRGFESAYKYIYQNGRVKKATILGGAKALSADAAGINENGKKKYGFLTIGKNIFYAQNTGELYKDRFFTINDKTYGATTLGSIIKNGWGKVGSLTYYFSDYLINDISRKAIAVLDKVGYTLEAAFKWSAALPYYRFDANPNWGSIWFADYGFTKGRGNCYVMGATFYMMAKTMGYDITQVAGNVNIWQLPHSWTLIKHKDGTWIYDPNCYNETDYYAFKVKNGKALWTYNSGWKEMPM